MSSRSEWLRFAAERDITRKDAGSGGSIRNIYALTSEGFLQYVKGEAEGGADDSWTITEAGRKILAERNAMRDRRRP